MSRQPHEMHQGIEECQAKQSESARRGEEFEAYYLGWCARVNGRDGIPPYQAGSRLASLFLSGYVDRLSSDKKGETE